MAEKFIVDKTDEDEILNIVEETITSEGINDAKSVVVEKTISAEDQRYIGGQLEGTPKQFDYTAEYILKSLQKLGVAAEFDEGWARGHKWREFVRG